MIAGLTLIVAGNLPFKIFSNQKCPEYLRNCWLIELIKEVKFLKLDFLAGLAVLQIKEMD